MEPYKAKKLPFEFEITNEILNLLCEAKEAYGEYKGYLKNMSYDYKCFLENAFINDIFYSFKIDNAKIEKDNMFYMSYMNKSNTSILYNNIKKSLLIGLTSSNKIGFSLETFNKINKTLLNGLKKDNSTKRSGHLRKTQTYLLKPGIAGSSVSFVPPVHTELNSLMKNLCEYINSKVDESFISTAITHYQFEKIHPFQDGNGSVGRLILFRECLRHNIVPFIITEQIKDFYYRGLKNYKYEKGYLNDTCLSGQDIVKSYLDYFKIEYK